MQEERETTTHRSQRPAARRTSLRFSLVVAFVGGIVDLGVGLLLLLTVSMSPSGDEMGVRWGYVGAILLLMLGGAVLATAVYMVGRPMAAARRPPGALMLLYGVLMLFVGVAMLARRFPMMQGSDVSGTAMLAIGLGMIYSGATMGKP